MRHPATQGRADANHRAVADAIRLLGYPVKDLSRNGDGVEDLLVGLHGRSREPWWIVCEIKVPKPERSKRKLDLRISLSHKPIKYCVF